MLTLAKSEMETVLALDTATLNTIVSSPPTRHGQTECVVQAGKLHLYYGIADGWCPLQFRTELLAAVPGLREEEARLDTAGLPHAFVESHGETMGQLVGEWWLQTQT